jgi:YhcN/YlaJ family sporulation lipoprotein
LNSYRKSFCAALVLLVLTMAGLSGCAGKTSSPAPGNGRSQAQGTGTGTSLPDGSNSGSVSNHLEKLARGVAGVQGANCVVFGRYAIVGIDVDPAMERSRVGTVKYAVAEAFRRDPHGIDALVTADIDLAQRIREIRTDIRHGRPVAGFTEELADIAGRLIPQIPRNIAPHRKPEDTGTP